jgi:hypothetical protein
MLSFLLSMLFLESQLIKSNIPVNRFRRMTAFTVDNRQHKYTPNKKEKVR